MTKVQNNTQSIDYKDIIPKIPEGKLHNELKSPNVLREQLVLGIILESPGQFKKIPLCTSKHFTNCDYRNIFKAIQAVAIIDSEPYLPNVAQELRTSGKSDLIQVLITLNDKSFIGHSIERVFQDLHKNYIKKCAKEMTVNLLNDIETSNDDLQTIVTDFNYNFKTLNGSDDVFAPFEMTLDYIPTQEAEVVTFQDETVLRKGDILTLISGEGFGKSRLISTIVSSHYSDCDTFGINLHLPDDELIVHIDTEQGKNEVFNSMKRIEKRTGNPKNLKNGSKIRNYILQSFATIPTIAEKRNWLFNTIEKYNTRIGVLILDGLTDFVSDINNLSEGQDFLARLGSYMKSYNFAVIATIHKNANDTNGKPRGHVGSELLRKSGAVLQLAKTQHTHQFSDDTEQEQVRTLTIDFLHGKNRFGKDCNLSTFFAWNDKEKMFTSCEVADVAQKTRSTTAKMEKLFNEVFENELCLGFSDLLIKYIDVSGKSERTVKRHISEATTKEILIKSNDGLYSLKGESPS